MYVESSCAHVCVHSKAEKFMEENKNMEIGTTGFLWCCRPKVCVLPKFICCNLNPCMMSTERGLNQGWRLHSKIIEGIPKG